jgi:hypothetical protein
MKRTVGVMTLAVVLCAQTGTYAAEQMSKERNGGQQSGQSGQDMQRPSGQSGQDMRQSGQDSQRKSGQSGQDVRQSDQPGQSGQLGQGQSGQSAQDMQRQSGQSGQSMNFSEEMQRQNKQIWQSGQQSQALCQKAAPVKQASAQPAPPAGDQPKQQAQAGQQPTPDQSKQQAQAGQQPTPDQSKQQAQAGQQPTPDQSKQQAQASQQLTQEQGRASSATQTIKGQFVRMEGDFYVVKDQSGKETCIPTSYGTFVDQTFSPGDTIVARLGQDGSALLIGRPSDRQTASSSSQGQEMSQGAGDQRGDRGFSGSQQGSQAQDSGARDQSMKSADKGMSGSQQAASTVKGELLKIQGEFYTVKDQSGSEVRLHVNKETKLEGPVNIGDKIEAERTPADHAISIKKAQDTGSSRSR